MNAYVLLVAGYEYHNGGTDFAGLCKRRANLLMDREKRWQEEASLIFILFDVRRGSLSRGTIQNNSILWEEEETDFVPINRSLHYQGHQFRQQENRVMSITDVYNLMITIGRNEPNTVRELTIMGHGWRGGPVLVNSFERDNFKFNGEDCNLRDPWDKDARMKDTGVMPLPDEEWRLFKSAFHAEGYVWLWGCASSEMYKGVINGVLQSPQFRAKPYGTHGDTDTFSLAFSQGYADRYFNIDPLFYKRSAPASLTTAAVERSFTRTLREVKDFLIRGMCHTYAAQFAYNMNRKVLASLVGTGTDFERSVNGSSIRFPLMVVPKSSQVFGYSFLSIINFYYTYLQVAEDPESRGFGLFDPAQIKAWKEA